jgi:hypothetical protein
MACLLGDKLFDDLVSNVNDACELDTGYISSHFRAACKGYCAEHWKRSPPRGWDLKGAVADIEHVRASTTMRSGYSWYKLLSIEVVARSRLAQKHPELKVDFEALGTVVLAAVNLPENPFSLLGKAACAYPHWSPAMQQKIVATVERVFDCIENKEEWTSHERELVNVIYSKDGDQYPRPRQSPKWSQIVTKFKTFCGVEENNRPGLSESECDQSASWLISPH